MRGGGRCRADLKEKHKKYEKPKPLWDFTKAKLMSKDSFSGVLDDDVFFLCDCVWLVRKNFNFFTALLILYFIVPFSIAFSFLLAQAVDNMLASANQCWQEDT